MEFEPQPVKPVMEPGFDVVTGAFSFTGRAIAQRLIAQERRVRTLTNHPQRPGSEEIKADVAPLQFADRAALVESLRGADVLYNTYWVRFRHGKLSFGDAIANTRILVGAAAEAGVRKIVHISVSNPSIDSHLDYYAGKARTEEIVRSSGLRWAIVRPTLVFGTGDILINNIAWLLRRLPFFLIPGDGGYRGPPAAVRLHVTEADAPRRQHRGVAGARCDAHQRGAAGIDGRAARVAREAARHTAHGQLAAHQRGHPGANLRLRAG